MLKLKGRKGKAHPPGGKKSQRRLVCKQSLVIMCAKKRGSNSESPKWMGSQFCFRFRISQSHTLKSFLWRQMRSFLLLFQSIFFLLHIFVCECSECLYTDYIYYGKMLLFFHLIRGKASSPHLWAPCHFIILKWFTSLSALLYKNSWKGII